MSNQKSKLVLCPKNGCSGKICVILGDRIVDIKRSTHRIRMTGRSYSTIMSCPYSNCKANVSIVIRDGKVINLDDLIIQESENNLDKKENAESKPDSVKTE